MSRINNRFFPEWEDEFDMSIEIDGGTEDRLVSLANSMDVSLVEAEYACLLVGLSALGQASILQRKAGGQA